jgi:hypothetical protein
MKSSFFALVFLISIKSIAQPDTSRWLRAFPITDYMVDLNDSTKVVQVHLADGTVIADKQLGLLKGIYRDSDADTGLLGFGRCNLVKGEYYYFSIKRRQGMRAPAAGDLIYTFMPKSPVYYGRAVKLASHFIGFKNVYNKTLVDRYDIFYRWTEKDERTLIDSLVSDIHFTGDYFLQNNPSMNVEIKSGPFKGKMVLQAMTTASRDDVTAFLDYMIAKPRLYAGQEWKIAEVFATWLNEGAPTAIRH